MIKKKGNIVRMHFHVPPERLSERPIEHLVHLTVSKDRSLSYLITEAILRYLEDEEK